MDWHLPLALVAPALVAAVANVSAWHLISWAEGLRLYLPRATAAFFMAVLGVGLVIQLVYGGLLYLVLKQLGLLNLPVLLFAYLAPPAIYKAAFRIGWTAANVRQHIIYSIPSLISGAILALGSWVLVSGR